MSRILKVNSCEDCPCRKKHEFVHYHNTYFGVYDIVCTLTNKKLYGSDTKSPKWKTTSKFPPSCPLKDCED